MNNRSLCASLPLVCFLGAAGANIRINSQSMSKALQTYIVNLVCSKIPRYDFIFTVVILSDIDGAKFIRQQKYNSILKFFLSNIWCSVFNES